LLKPYFVSDQEIKSRSPNRDKLVSGRLRNDSKLAGFVVVMTMISPLRQTISKHIMYKILRSQLTSIRNLVQVAVPATTTAKTTLFAIGRDLSPLAYNVRT
jgi:hypothetical protein